MSVAKYTEEDVQALKIEANDRVRNLTKAMDAKYEKLELEMADTKAKAIRMERAYGQYTSTAQFWPVLSGLPHFVQAFRSTN